MDNIEFLQIFGDIDDQILRQANDALNLYRESQEGVSFRADYSRRSPRKAIITAVACIAAAVTGVFVLLPNIWKMKLNGFPESNNGIAEGSVSSGTNSTVYSVPEQSGSDRPVEVSIHLNMNQNVQGKADKLTDKCWALKDGNNIRYFADCWALENCTITVEGINNFPDKRLEFSSPGRIEFMASTDESLIGFKAVMTVIDPEKPASANVNINSEYIVNIENNSEIM